MRARDLLKDGATLVIIKDGIPRAFYDRGVIALYRLACEVPCPLDGADVADVVVGRAAALIMASRGVKSVYAGVLSMCGKAALEEAGIPFEYGELTQNIINRNGDDLCPMEKAVKGCSAAESVQKIGETLKALGILK